MILSSHSVIKFPWCHLKIRANADRAGGESINADCVQTHLSALAKFAASRRFYYFHAYVLVHAHVHEGERISSYFAPVASLLCCKLNYRSEQILGRMERDYFFLGFTGWMGLVGCGMNVSRIVNEICRGTRMDRGLHGWERWAWMEEEGKICSFDFSFSFGWTWPVGGETLRVVFPCAQNSTFELLQCYALLAR